MGGLPEGVSMNPAAAGPLRNRATAPGARAAGVLAGLLLVPALAAAQAPSGAPYEFLRHEIGFGEEDLAALAGEQAIGRVVETPEKREIAIAGAVHIRASTAFFLRMFRAIESFDTAARVSHELSDPPVAADFADLTIPEALLPALADCRPGRCGMKLGETTIARFREEVDWGAPDARARAEAILREEALALANAYRTGGNRSLGSYRDRKQPGRIAEDFEALLANAPYVLGYRPALHRHLLDYPDSTLEGATDFLYWGEYDYGKPVLRLSHVTIQTAGGDDSPATIAVKHLWYTHQFTTGLDLHVLVPDAGAESGAFHLVSLSRMRTDSAGGVLRGVIEKRIVADVLDGFRAYLASLKGAVERYYANEAPGGS